MHEAFQGLDAEGKLAQRKGTFGAQATKTQALKIFRDIVFWSVDDTQVFRATTLYGRLNQAALPTHNEVKRLDDHTFTTLSGNMSPPGNALLHASRIVDIN